MDRSSVGREDADQRAVRGSAQRRHRAVQSDQQDQPRFGEEDPNQGIELPADGEHPTVRPRLVRARESNIYIVFIVSRR